MYSLIYIEYTADIAGGYSNHFSVPPLKASPHGQDKKDPTTKVIGHRSQYIVYTKNKGISEFAYNASRMEN